MGQRGKVLDTEGPTPKFLYAMLKQLDLKTIDWNVVASNIEISNGHAARMRFSRFRNQMEGTTGSQRAANRKKNAKAKKVEKGEKGDMGDPRPPMIPAGLKMEPADYLTYSNPVKSEPNTQKSSGPQPFSDVTEMYHWPQLSSANGSGFNHQMNPFMPQGMSYPLMPSFSSSTPMTPMSPPAFYPPYTMSQDFNMSDMGVQQNSFPNAPILSWEPPVSSPDQTQAPVLSETPVQTDTHIQLDPHIQPEPQPEVQAEPGIPSEPNTPPLKIEDDTDSKISVKMEPFSLE